MRRLTLVAAAIAQIGAVNAAELVRISVNGIELRGAIPIGYCKPEGKGIDVANGIAKLDVDNETILVLFPCSQDRGYDFLFDYFVVNRPVGSEKLQINREEFLKAYREFRKSNQSTTSTSEESISIKENEYKIQKIIEPKEGDDICDYSVVKLDIPFGKTTYQAIMSTCATTVGKQVLVFRYISEPDSTGSLKLPLQMVRKIAEGFSATDGRAN